MSSITIDPGSLRNGALAIQTCRDGLHGVADRVRGMGHPEGISGDTIAAMNGGVSRIHSIGVASEHQMAYLVQTANAAEKVGGFGASLLSAFALNLRSPFPAADKKHEKVPWYKQVTRSVKEGGKAAGNFTYGAASELYDQGKGVAQLAYIGSPAKVKDAIAAAKWIAASPENRKAFLKELAKSEYADIAKEWQGGEKSKAAGRAAMRGALNVIPAAKLAQLAKLSKVVKLAQKAEKLASQPARTINGKISKNLLDNATKERKKVNQDRAALNENNSISAEERRIQEAELKRRDDAVDDKLRSHQSAEERQKKLESADKMKGRVEAVTDPVVSKIQDAEDSEKERELKEQREKERKRQEALLNQIRRGGVESVL